MAWLKRTVTRWLRLPPDPRPPAGSEESVRIFHAAPNYFRYAMARWVLRQLGVVLGVLFVVGFWQPFQEMLKIETQAEVVDEIRSKVPLAPWVDRLNLVDVRPQDDDPERVIVSFGPALFWIELFGIGFVVLQAPLTYTLVRLDYEMRWYIVTDCSLRIREGITSLHEATMTFGNIQNLAIEQGPIQRLLGIADLRVRTAGGGSSGDDESSEDGKKSDSLHIAYFRGVDNAPELRDAILAHLQRLKSAGLGEAPPPATADDADRADSAVAAARAVLQEARAMRAAIERSR